MRGQPHVGTGAGGLATLPPEMRIALGSDHAGYPLKEHLSTWLAESGHAVYDLGTHSAEPVDYPDYAAAVAQAVFDGRADRGILICGSGAGAAVAANKLQGIRASIAHDTYTAHQMVEHDDVNVLSLGSRVIGESLAEELVTTFLEARFSPRGPARAASGEDQVPGGLISPRRALGRNCDQLIETVSADLALTPAQIVVLPVQDHDTSGCRPSRSSPRSGPRSGRP